jgi:hypothetical protein
MTSENDDPINIEKTVGRKIPPDKENPFDDMFIGVGEKFLDPLYKAGVTPNMITTASFGFGLMSLYFLINDRIELFGLFFLLGYLCDCMDGAMARRYHMESVFGDYYDHITDTVVGLGLFGIVCTKYYKQFGLCDILVFAFLLVMMNVHIGCQQNIYCSDITQEYNDEILNYSRKMCPDAENNIYMSRYFGLGTFMVGIVMFVMYYDLSKRGAI